ncbi:hypothetical protein [Kribbella sp. NPDC051620]
MARILAKTNSRSRIEAMNNAKQAGWI